MRDILRELDATTQAVDQAPKEQTLDAETSSAWAGVRASAMGTGSPDVSELDSMTGAISQEARFALRARLDAFDPILDMLVEREGELHPAVAETSSRLVEALDTLESLEGDEPQSVLGQKKLRKRRCCIVEFVTAPLIARSSWRCSP